MCWDDTQAVRESSVSVCLAYSWQALQAIEKEEVVENAPATLCKEDASSDESMRVKFEQAVRKAQDEICKAVSDMDGKEFHEDAWTRPGGGGGVSRVLQVVAICT